MKINYLRISVTDRCNFSCVYCVPPGGVPKMRREELLGFDDIVRFTEAAVSTGISRVRVTGGEPLVRAGCTGLIERLAAVPGVRDLSLTTNGALLTGLARELRQAGLGRINISIDSLDPGRFARLTGSDSLDAALAGLDSAVDAGFAPVKVNAVALDGIEDDLQAFVELARERPVHVRFIEYMPIGRRVGGLWRFVPRRRLLARLAEFGRLEPVASPGGGGPARYFKFAGAAGTLGFISSMSDHFCAECNRLRLTADGRLRNCLFSDEEVDVRPFIGGEREALSAVIRDSMNSKKYDRGAVEPGCRTMSQIGG